MYFLGQTCIFFQYAPPHLFMKTVGSFNPQFPFWTRDICHNLFAQFLTLLGYTESIRIICQFRLIFDTHIYYLILIFDIHISYLVSISHIVSMKLSLMNGVTQIVTQNLYHSKTSLKIVDIKKVNLQLPHNISSTFLATLLNLDTIRVSGMTSHR